MEIVVFGAGVMGASFAQALARSGSQVQLVLSDVDNRIHPQLLKEHQHNVLGALTQKLNLVLEKPVQAQSLIIIAVSVSGLTWAWEQLQEQPTDVPVLFLSKGLLSKDRRLMTISGYFESLCEQSKRNSNPWQVIAGPCLARDLFDKKPLQALLGGVKPQVHQTAELIRKALPSLELSEDVKGISFCSALKNIYSIIISAVRQQSPSFSGVVFVRVIEEMIVFLKNNGCESKTATGLAGMGDLYLTSFGGRNGILGQELGRTQSIQSALETMKGVTLEGYELAKLIEPILRGQPASEQNYPILMKTLNVLIHNAKFSVDDFILG